VALLRREAFNEKIKKMKFNLNFYLKRNRIEAVITFAGNRITFYTGLTCTAEKFDKQAGRVKKNCSVLMGRREIQYNIANSILARIDGAASEYFLKTDKPNRDEIINLLRKASGKPEKAKKTIDFWELWEKYIIQAEVTPGRRRHLIATRNRWKDFAASKRISLKFPRIDTDMLRDFKAFLLTDKGRGRNTVIQILKTSRAFWKWARLEHSEIPDPWVRGIITTERYGIPVYLLQEEIAKLEAFIPEIERLKKVRDLFLFQCYIGCRVSDLMRLTKNNIQGNILEYIPKKTKSERPVPVRIPLNKKAQEILNRNYNEVSPYLLPRISEQKYNEYLKELFFACGLNRTITRLNPRTEKEEKIPLYKIASSHMARRTFVGNLFGLADPEVIAAMTGHAAGSKAFHRYHDIPDDLKIKATKLL